MFVNVVSCMNISCENDSELITSNKLFNGCSYKEVTTLKMSAVTVVFYLYFQMMTQYDELFIYTVAK